jgi:predicted O-methyltransferase YrrM
MHLPVLYRLEKTVRPFWRRRRARFLTWIGCREAAVINLSRLVDGWFGRAEIRWLYRAVRHAGGSGDIAEIGSWKGRSTVVMGLALKDAKIRNCRIFAIDHHQGSEEHEGVIAREGSTLPMFQQNIRELGVADVVEPMVMRSDEAAKRLALAGVRLRLLFIDGAHDEESVRQDIRRFLPLVHARGIIALHDCEPYGGAPGVWRAFQSELATKVDIMAQAGSLLVTRLRS